jgi:hypothetical protein
MRAVLTVTMTDCPADHDNKERPVHMEVSVSPVHCSMPQT